MAEMNSGGTAKDHPNPLYDADENGVVDTAEDSKTTAQVQEQALAYDIIGL